MAHLNEKNRDVSRFQATRTRLEPSMAGAAAGGGASGALREVEASLVSFPEDSPHLGWLRRTHPERRLLRGATYRAVKRTFDVGFAVLSAPVTLPVLGLCWAAVKMESPRAPALFVQQRTGHRGARFRMLKFRTMIPEAEDLKGQLAARNKLRWPDFKVEDDPRITRVGRLLRKTSLDELPQIFNVLRGDMSLVGPRPTSFPVETYEEWHKARLEAIPGITGLWQIAGRGEMEFDDRVRLDVAYIERQGFALDLQILLRTAAVVFSRRGAH